MISDNKRWTMQPPFLHTYEARGYCRQGACVNGAVPLTRSCSGLRTEEADTGISTKSCHVSVSWVTGCKIITDIFHLPTRILLEQVEEQVSAVGN